MSRLERGDAKPEIVAAPPAERSRALCRELARAEAPGINTLVFGPAILWREALGANVLDVDGNRYVDLTAAFGVANVGHRHPAVVAAVRRQSEALIHGLGDVHAHPGRPLLARRLGELAPVDDPVVYFAISGSDAVEIALKTALLATGRGGVLAFEPAYHGVTLGALAATSRPEFRRPFAARLRPHVERLPFGCAPARVEALLAQRREIGCAVIEPIVGREGVLLPPAGWIEALADSCRRHGVLLVADEVYTGFGRTGRWFALDHHRVRADLLCCGKALGGGLPIAAVVARRELLDAWEHPGEARHTATFVAHPLACAAALAVVEALESERLVERAARLAEVLAPRLDEWPGRFPRVRKVRGRGLLWGAELDGAESARRLVRGALERGVLVLAGGPGGNVVQLCPPLVITRDQLEAALAILEETLAAVAA